MDPVEIVLRLLHFVFGIFWAGSTFFIALVLLGLLRSLGPKTERSFWLALFRSPAMLVFPLAALVTIGSGIAMALKDRWGDLDAFLSTGWGWAILISFAATMAYLVLVFTVDDQNTRNMKKLLTNIEGREPDSKEGQQLAEASSRMTAVIWTEFALMLIAVGAMAAARFV